MNRYYNTTNRALVYTLTNGETLRIDSKTRSKPISDDLVCNLMKEDLSRGTLYAIPENSDNENIILVDVGKKPKK